MVGLYTLAFPLGHTTLTMTKSRITRIAAKVGEPSFMTFMAPNR